MDMRRSGRIADSLVSIVRMLNVMKDRPGGSGFRILPLDPRHSALILLAGGELTMSELGERLMRSKPNMTAIIGGMIKEGVVRRMSDPKDRRIVKIAITPKGRKRLAERRKAIGEGIARNLGTLDDHDLESLCASLENVSRIAGKLKRE
jgi:DNA-binding MarR family transcriptional regulator